MLTPSHVSFHQDCYHPRAYLAAMASATLIALATVRSLPCLSYVADAAICGAELESLCPRCLRVTKQETVLAMKNEVITKTGYSMS